MERAKLDHDPSDMLRLMGFLLPDFTINVKSRDTFLHAFARPRWRKRYFGLESK